jgi:hypothetical protein
LFSQNESLKTGSLPVFVVIDKDVSAIIDSFIMEAQKYSNHYPSFVFSMYIGLYEDNDIHFSLTLDLSKQEKISDSIILYKHPNCRQILVSHNNHLFETAICKYPDFNNKIHFPTTILKKTRKKHKVYYKKPSLDYFRDNPTKGEVIYENQLLGWLYHYYHGHWQEDVKISF